MARKSSKQNKSKTNGKTPSVKTSGFLSDRRRLLKVAAVSVFALGGAATLHAYDTKKREIHDLNVIGQGSPVIVQIHDPGCPTCRRLKGTVESALEGNNEVVYRLADIKTRSGKQFQEKYAVPHVTLLWFDSEGEHVHTTTGLQEASKLKSLVTRHFR